MGETVRNERVVLDSISTLNEISKKAPKLEAVPTGIKGLDDLFFTSQITKGKAVKKPLGGIPKYSVFNITGVSDTGKSLLVEQFSVYQASNDNKVTFITVETPAEFVAMALKERAKSMNLEEKKVDDNIIIIDASSHRILREDYLALLDTLAHVIKTYKTQIVVIDSITGFYENREMQARSIVRPIYNFLKKWHQTALLVAQKRSGHEEFSAEAAGGYAVSHIVDGTMVLFKEIIDTTYKERMYGLPIGEMIRLFRIDGCRMCGHDSSTHILKITDLGLIEIGPNLMELKNKGGGGKNDTK